MHTHARARAEQKSRESRLLTRVFFVYAAAAAAVNFLGYVNSLSRANKKQSARCNCSPPPRRMPSDN